jgi:hypothetical protein
MNIVIVEVDVEVDVEVEGVMVALKDADVSMRRRALDLLFVISDADNAVEIVEVRDNGNVKVCDVEVNVEVDDVEFNVEVNVEVDVKRCLLRSRQQLALLFASAG